LWQIDLIVRGQVQVEQGRGIADLGPTNLILIDPARPVRYASIASTSVTILVPRQELRLRPADAARLVGVPIKGDCGPAALVFTLARDMARSLTGFRSGAAHRSAAAIAELISVMRGAQLGETHPDSSDALCDRILGYIEAQLSDPRLTPAQIAVAHHISVRRLHKLFEDQPRTVAALIRRRRLERCHADFLSSDRTVTAVAARWGFVDPAYFSRLFKATYGYNATALKSNHGAGEAMAPARSSGDPRAIRSEATE
jgi:AraC-like DNA-binding protein